MMTFLLCTKPWTNWPPRRSEARRSWSSSGILPVSPVRAGRQAPRCFDPGHGGSLLGLRSVRLFCCDHWENAQQLTRPSGCGRNFSTDFGGKRRQNPHYKRDLGRSGTNIAMRIDGIFGRGPCHRRSAEDRDAYLQQVCAGDALCAAGRGVAAGTLESEQFPGARLLRCRPPQSMNR